MLASSETINTGHEDSLHDAQMDYYGKRLATASADKKIKIFDVVHGNQYQHQATLIGHEGPIWQLSWAHPKFGNILASCSYDKKVIVWKEENPGSGQWARIYTHSSHEQSVNSISFGPHEYGLQLVCGSSDGSISILSSNGDGIWEHEKWLAHNGGCNAVNWAPPVENGALSQSDTSSPIKRIVSGGCDNLVKIWKYSDSLRKWESSEPEFVLKKHEDWVRDVAFCPNMGFNGSTLATCGQDMRLYIWKRKGEGSDWTCTPIDGFNDIIWKVSWSVTGHVLAVTTFDKVSLWRETPEEEWKMLHTEAPTQ